MTHKVKNYVFSNISFVIPHTYKKSSFIIQDLDQEQERALHHHIHSDDYFGTVASLFQLYSEGITTADDTKIFENLKDEMVYLQEHYSIQKRIQ